MKSKSGYIFSLSSGVFSWLSQKQDIVTQSTIGAKYVIVCATTNQAVRLREF